MENEKCKFSYSPGNEKNNEGTFLRFSEQIINDEDGRNLQQTMAIVLNDKGDMVQVEPSCIKIVES